MQFYWRPRAETIGPLIVEALKRRPNHVERVDVEFSMSELLHKSSSI